MLKVGLEIFLEQELSPTLGERVGYLSNHACTNRSFVHGKDLIAEKLGDRLTCLFSPQHGFFAEKQDNMIESDHVIDVKTGLPIFSLYGEHRKPTKEMFDHLDTLLVDLVDIGTRVYTFMYTMAYCLEAAAEYGKKIIILDRPNPIGGEQIEGNILDDDYRSFVGLYNIPMRHGLSLGELALFFNAEYKIGAMLEVVEVTGWSRKQYIDETDFPWVVPSPNMPTVDAAVNYPGQVIWEGTAVSEARGTTMPFCFVGAPYWKHDEMLAFLARYEIPGAVLRPVVFEPMFGKWVGHSCVGFQVHVTDRRVFNSYRAGLILLQAAILVYPAKFEYKQPPYEYEYYKMPIDLILGDKSLREQIESGVSVDKLEQQWMPALKEYDIRRKKYFLYN